MKSKTMILMVVAVVCGLAASYMTSRLLADRNEKVQVLVAKQKYNAWTPIKNPEEQFEVDERLRTEVPKNAVIRMEALKDHVLIRPMDKGDVAVAENLLSKDKTGLEVQLSPGMRAVAVRTTAEVVAGGFVMPGSHVDVIHATRRGDRDADTRVVLQDAKVLAVDTLSTKPEDRTGLVPATVTLELSLTQASTLAAVKDTGHITFALRGYGDNKVENVSPPAPPKPAVVAKGPERARTLVIQNGHEWTRATFVVKDGETQTTVERTHEQPAAPPQPAAPVTPATPAKQPGARTAKT